ncbi:hypothetical protein MMC24_004241 [Lignoscripta atroalba]|nr:hypothetical protein [Lignoscripta atroalba]
MDIELGLVKGSARRRQRSAYIQSPVALAHGAALQAPWTSARCNRLLRPLSSRIALLRKDTHRSTQQYSELFRADLSKDSIISSQTITRPTHPHHLQGPYNSSPFLEQDPDWAPDAAPRKKLKRTYSSRSQVTKQTKASTQGAEGGIQVPSAYAQACEDVSINTNEGASKIRHVHIGNDPPPRKPMKTGPVEAPTRDSFRRLAQSISPCSWMLIDGLYNGLDALLRATTRNKPAVRSGSRSLFSTCLKNVPAYITEEQFHCEEEDPDAEVDVASMIYADLEAHGSSHTGGWKPLREIVRAHGIYLLGSGIKDGLISAPIARGLVILCLQRAAYDEARCLVESLIAVAGPLSRPKAASDKLFHIERSICLKTLLDCSSRSGDFGFECRQLAFMLDSGLLPVEWMSCSDMIETWNRVIRSITQEDVCAKDATLLLRTAVSLSYRNTSWLVDYSVKQAWLRLRSTSNASKLMPSESRQASRPPETELHKSGIVETALNNTISSLLTVLLAVSLARADSANPDLGKTNRLSLRTIKEIAIDAHQAFELSAFSSKTHPLSPIQAGRASMTLFADYLADAILIDIDKQSPQSSIRWLGMVTEITSLGTSSDCLASFLCGVALCWEQAASKDAFEFLQRIVGRLVYISKSQFGETRMQRLLSGIAVAAGFQYAEQRSQRGHLDWALEVEEDVGRDSTDSVRQTPGKTPGGSSSRATTGFRWEEGICEWVAKTPALTISKDGTHQQDNCLYPSTEHGRDSKVVQNACAVISHETSMASGVSSYSVWKKRDLRAQDKMGHRLEPVLAIRGSSNISVIVNTVPGTGATPRPDCVGCEKTDQENESLVDCTDNDDADELSTPEASQQSAVDRPRLNELRNLRHLGSRPARRRSTRRRSDLDMCRSSSTSKRTNRWGRSSLAWGVDEHGSEDELGI